MLNINTNLSSLIAQNSLKQSTNKLNTAIERMSTGCKINHAKDNAANYSISTNMTTKIGAYQVAEDNALQGLDMINTASESLTLIEDKLMRLRALAEQSANGTYGTQSKQAINQEANAIVDEIERLYNTTEYNGINLAKGKVIGAEESKFIKDIDRRDTSKMTTLASVKIDEALTSGTFSISTADELAKLATMTNNGLIGAGCEFVLGADIDLNGYSNWIPIGKNDIEEHNFKGDFDGNGYKISGLKISNGTDFFQGLFGCVNNSNISNINLENANIICSNFHNGTLIGVMIESCLDNCITSGTLTNVNNGYSGGVVGVIANNSTVSSCCSSVNVIGKNAIGGFASELRNGCVLKNCYSLGDVEGTGITAGGLVAVVGYSGNPEGYATIINCYSTGNVKQYSFAGGFIGECFSDVLVKNSYCTGEITEKVAMNGSGAFIAGGRQLNYEKNIILEECFVLGNFSTASYIDHQTGIFVGSFLDPTNLTIKNCGYGTELSNSGVGLVGNVSNVSTFNISINDKIPYILITDSKIFNRIANLNLQIGIDNESSSQISFNTNYVLKNLSVLSDMGIVSYDYLTELDKMLAQVSEKQTEFGAVQNRLESVVEEIGIQYDNLVSSRSTLRDADIAEVSAEYIQQQILQQASATLMATANQSASIALSLI